MAPEQAKSSIDVDHRADIYSLGCTCYVLLTGKRPFEEKSLQELVSKHDSGPLVEPRKIVERVLARLSSIVVRMMAKKPEDHYPNMADLIAELETYQGVSPTAAFTPDESDADTFEQCVKEFNLSPLCNFRSLIPLASCSGDRTRELVALWVRVNK